MPFIFHVCFRMAHGAFESLYDISTFAHNAVSGDARLDKTVLTTKMATVVQDLP